MQHLLKDNLCLITIRRSRSQEKWNFAFVSNGLVSGSTAISSLDINYVFPLYLYRETSQQKRKSSVIQLMLFEPEETYLHKIPNINPEFYKKLKQDLKKEISPEEIFYYIYAVLSSNLYRSKYADLLKLDLPRLPFPKSYNLFSKLSLLGKQLIELHLLNSKELKNIKTKFPILGDNRVEKVEFEILKNNFGRVWINEKQYFEDIPENVWNYKIGGYQVCNKWLSDRKGRTLNKEEIVTYRQIVTALIRTMEIQKEIDKYYQQVENSF
jgi:predicted helicase